MADNDEYDPVNGCLGQHSFMRSATWMLILPPLEKLTLLKVLHRCEFDRTPTCLIELNELAEYIGGSALDASRAISSLKQKGVLEVQEFPGLRAAGITTEMHLTPDFDGFRAFWLEQGDQRREQAQ